jgi:hypothetical protein
MEKQSHGLTTEATPTLFGKLYYTTTAWCGTSTMTTYWSTPTKWMGDQLIKIIFKPKNK